MAAYKRPDRDGYLIRPTIIPWGRLGPWQTGATSKRQAEAIESWLRQVALEHPEIVEALVEGRFGKKGLQVVWIAKLRGKLDDLMLSLSDPLLAAVAPQLESADERVRQGLAKLAGLADAVEARRATAEKRPVPRPGTARLSWLLEPRNVMDLYTVAGQTMAAGSVSRSIHRAVADLVAHHYGKARRDELMAEVEKPAVSDEREVRVSADEIAAVLRECGPMFADLPALAMLLAVDRGPLLRVTPRYFDEALGALEVLDHKTSARPRTIELSTPAWSILRRRCSGRGPDERIFDLTEGQVRHLWEASRDRAAGLAVSRNQRERGTADPIRQRAERMLAEHGVVTLPILRFKDLRHLLPTAWNALGFSTPDLQEIMGHARGSKQTDRYITARIAGNREQMDRVAAFLGLDRLHLRAAGE